MTTHPTFTSPGGERLVVVPEAEYLKIVEAFEDMEDIAAVDRIGAKIATGEEELIPSEIVDRLLAGENRVRVWREYRGLTLAKLAELAGIDASYVSSIETGRREGKADTLASLASVLKVEPGDLIQKPANARIEEILAEREGWHSVAELAGAVGASESHTRAVCEWMVVEGKAERQEGSPVRYKGV